MNNEEKILEILEKLDGTVEKHGEMLERLSGTVENLSGTVEKHGEMLERLSSTVENLSGTVEKHSVMLERLQTDVSGIKVRLDVEVKQQFNLLAEGQQVIREILVPRERMEEMEADISVLKTTVQIHSRDIAQLKQAR